MKFRSFYRPQPPAEEEKLLDSDNDSVLDEERTKESGCTIDNDGERANN